MRTESDTSLRLVPRKKLARTRRPIMARNAIILLLLSSALTWACGDASEANVDQAGMPFALTPSRPWRLEPPPPDTLNTVTRRVWYGDEVDPTGTPSRDGRFFTHPDMETGALAIRDLATGETRLLTDFQVPYYPGFAQLPRFSPNGSQVAYSWWQSDAPSEFSLRVIDVDAAEPRDLGTAGWIQPDGWTPDGLHILVNRATDEGTDLVLVSAEDGSEEVLRHWGVGEMGPGKVVMSPDGRFLLVERSESTENLYSKDIFALPLNGNAEVPVVQHPANDFVLGWAPGGDHILFGSDRTGTPGAWLQPVRDGMAQGEPLLVKPDLWGVWGLGFTNDGRFFYSVSTGGREIHVANLDHEAGRVVGSPEVMDPHALGSQSRPSWSHDGRYLAYLAEQFRGTSTSNPPTLAIRSVETGQERLLRLPADVYLPREHYWLADGHNLLLRYMDRDMATGIRRIDLRTGESERVFFRPEGNVHNTMVTPDGGTIFVYSREDGPEKDRMDMVLRTREVGSGEEEEIFRATGGAENLTLFSALSPDGTTIAGWRGDGTSAFGRLLTIPATGGDFREIPTPDGTRLGYQIAWSRDQRFLITTRPEDLNDLSNPLRHLVRVDIETGEVHDMGLSGESIMYLRLSPDGRQLAYVAGSESYEVWVMENFLPGGERR